MATKDYVKRGNPKANNRHKKKAPEKKPLPVVAMGLIVVILSGFGYLLWTISGAADNPTQADNNESAKPQVIAAKPKRQLVPKSTSNAAAQQPDVPPPPEQEQWQYIDELKNKTVDVAITEVEKQGPFLMQCATFKDGRRAEAFKAQLALLGFESRIKVTQASNGKRHRVQLGPYEKNRDAQRARHKLSKHNINGCKIWLWS